MALRDLCRHPHAVRLCGQRLRVSVCLLIALVAVLTLTAAQATAKRDRPACTWGASSIHAQLVDGKLVVSRPATSGCIPK
jgi:hypothetical protein